MWSLVLIILIVVSDQLSKMWVLEHFQNQGDVIHILPFFDIVLAFNRGVSFSFFGTVSGNAFWILTFFIICITLCVAVWWYREKSPFCRICLSMIIGGAIGNIIDRFRQGAVVDFLDFFWQNYHWPAFNLADSFIFVGVMMLVANAFLTKNNRV